MLPANHTTTLQTEASSYENTHQKAVCIFCGEVAQTRRKPFAANQPGWLMFMVLKSFASCVMLASGSALWQPIHVAKNCERQHHPAEFPLSKQHDITTDVTAAHALAPGPATQALLLRPDNTSQTWPCGNHVCLCFQIQHI